MSCKCNDIKEAMLDGHPNPEAAEEYKQAYGHYYECPDRSSCNNEHGGTGLVCDKPKGHNGVHRAYWGPSKSWVMNW